MRPFKIFAILQLVLSTGLSAQLPSLGTPVIRNFTKEEYSGGTQNWAALQSPDGLIWIANNQGLLEFDGLEWRIHPLPNRTIVRSITRDSSGNIYVGGQGEIGVFRPNAYGNLEYTDLTYRLPQEYRQFEDVWNIVLDNDRILFRASYTLLAIPLKDGEIGYSIENQGDILYLGACKTRILAQVKDQGLFYLDEGQSMRPVHHSTQNLSEITAIMPGSGRGEVISTLKNGLFLLDSSGIREFPNEASTYWLTHRIYTALQLSDGRYAMGTSSGGLVILDSTGALNARYTKKQGVQNSTVLGLAEDRAGSLWLGLDNGISVVAASSYYSRFYPDGDLAGTAYAMQEYQGNYYCGTNNGLYVLAKDSPFDDRNFKLVPGTEGQVWSLQIVRGELIMGHHEGVFRIDNRTATKLGSATGAWTFVEWPTADEQEAPRMIAGTYNGLQSYRWQNGWQYEGAISGLDESSRFLACDPYGYIWVAHPYRGIWRAKLHGLELLDLEYLGEKQGLPSNIGLQLYPIAGDVIFTASVGTWVFNRQSNRFEPHPILDTMLGRETAVRRLIATEDGDIWYALGPAVGSIRIEDKGLYKTSRRMSIPELIGQLVGGFENIYDPTGPDVFFATDRGFIQFTGIDKTNRNPGPQVLIRKTEVLGRSDSLLFSGAGDPGNIQDAVLPARMNAFHFSFSSTEFIHPERMTYSWWLEGFERQWSGWSDKTEKEYTNLKPGDYAFHVRAQDIDGLISDTVTYRFRIEAPWYSSTVALVLYALLITGGLLLLIILPRRRFAKDKAEMADEQERTLREQEERHKATEATRSEEIMQLRNEKLQNELEFQNGQLATTTLHLVQKNALIVRLKEELEKIESVSVPDEMKISLRQAAGILNNDERLDEDWEQFAIHFDKVHADFLARLREQFPQLTPRDHKLCAFLRMNLSSKEIAPLLYISVRGVEISRYRLRKKLELDADANLTEFLVNI